MKAYISHWKDAEDREDVMNYWFTFNPATAAVWRFRRAAEDSASFFEHNPIAIITRQGSQKLRGFQIEELQPDKFLIWCDGPFEQMERAPFAAQIPEPSRGKAGEVPPASIL
jgi:hypothetical protein